MLAVLDRERRARRQHVARRLARILVEQGEARTQILLRGGGAIFDHHLLRDAGRLVGLLGERLVLDEILILHHAGLLGDHRHHERIPLRHAIALRDDVRRRRTAGARRKGCGASNARGRPCRRSRVPPNATSRRGGRAGRRSSAGRDSSIVPSVGASRFDGLVELRRAADVEGPHRQLRARLADRLRGDDADRLADVDRRAAGEIAPVAGGADAADALADQRRADLHRLRRRSPRSARPSARRAACPRG